MVVNLVVNSLLPAPQTLQRRKGGGVRRFDSPPSLLRCRGAMPCATSRFGGDGPGKEEGGQSVAQTRNGGVSCSALLLTDAFVFRELEMTGEGSIKTPLLCPCANTTFKLLQTPNPRYGPGEAAPLRRGGRRRGAALPLQTFPFPSLAASFPPLFSSLPLSAPRRRWLRGRGAPGEHRCPSGPCLVPAAAPKATSPPSPPPGEPASCGPTWVAQVRGRERRVLVSEPPRTELNRGIWDNISSSTLFPLPSQT